jgi:hypothetical protein
MAEKTVPLTARVPEEERDAVEDLADERAKSKSAMTRELVQRGLETIDEDDRAPEPSRTASPLTILGVVAIAVAPTLLATGYTGLGVVLGLVAAVYALLWVTAYDTVLEDVLDTARDKLREVGGVVGFFRYVATDHHVEDPDTVVERAARLDLVGQGLLVGLLVVLVPLGIAGYLGALGPFLAAIGTTGVRAIAVLIIVLTYGFAFLAAVSTLASLAIASAATEDDAVVDDDTTA